MRVLNLIPDAPPLNVTVAGNLAYPDVPFQGITGYQSFDNQITNFAVSVPGATTPLVELSANLSGSQPYALVISGLMSSPIVTLVVEFVNSGSSGNAQMSVFNGAINQGNVDVYLTAPGVDLNTVNPNFFAVTYNGEFAQPRVSRAASIRCASRPTAASPCCTTRARARSGATPPRRSSCTARAAACS